MFKFFYCSRIIFHQLPVFAIRQQSVEVFCASIRLDFTAMNELFRVFNIYYQKGTDCNFCKAKIS